MGATRNLGRVGLNHAILEECASRYVRGGEAEYLKDGSIRRTNGRVEFDTTESRTDMVRMQIGVVCRF